MRSRQHRRLTGFRPTARRDPCAGGQPQSRGLRGSASEDGNHGCGYDAGCSAGTCACSRESSHNWLVTGSLATAGVSPGRWGQRPYNGTGPRQTGQTGWPSTNQKFLQFVQTTRRGPVKKRWHLLHCRGDIASVTGRRLLLLLADSEFQGSCPSAVGGPGFGQFPRLIHTLWTTVWSGR